VGPARVAVPLRGRATFPHGNVRRLSCQLRSLFRDHSQNCSSCRETCRYRSAMRLSHFSAIRRGNAPHLSCRPHSPAADHWQSYSIRRVANLFVSRSSWESPLIVPAISGSYHSLIRAAGALRHGGTRCRRRSPSEPPCAAELSATACSALAEHQCIEEPARASSQITLQPSPNFSCVRNSSPDGRVAKGAHRIRVLAHRRRQPMAAKDRPGSDPKNPGDFRHH
jgi:hypothetical protein